MMSLPTYEHQRKSLRISFGISHTPAGEKNWVLDAGRNAFWQAPDGTLLSPLPPYRREATGREGITSEDAQEIQPAAAMATVCPRS